MFYKHYVINPHFVDEKTNAQEGELTNSSVGAVGIWIQIYPVRKSMLWTLQEASSLETRYLSNNSLLGDQIP